MFLLHLASFVHVFVVKKESLVSFESVIQCRAFYSRSTSLRYISIGLLRGMAGKFVDTSAIRKSNALLKKRFA